MVAGGDWLQTHGGRGYLLQIFRLLHQFMWLQTNRSFSFQDWQWSLGSVSLLFAWLDLLVLLRKLPLLGVYLILFADVASTFFQFFPIFFLIIVAFALSFYMQMFNQVVIFIALSSCVHTLLF